MDKHKKSRKFKIDKWWHFFRNKIIGYRYAYDD